MTFTGPDLSDYENVISLNEAWLGLLQQDTRLAAGVAELPERLRCHITGLGKRQISRLATTPFLLFSFRESDERYWTRVLTGSPERDLFEVNGTEEVNTFISAGLGFIWQLARRNPYALRLICGATLYWTDRIAEQTFYGLLNAVRATGDVPCARFVQRRELWSKLLEYGVSRERLKRHATQLSALQAILTEPPRNRAENWALAARTARAPQLRVAEENKTLQKRQSAG